MSARQKVVIIDTACANVQSVRHAIERLDYSVTVSCQPDELLSADKLFLPGVGTAHEAMKNLRQRHLIPLLKKVDQPLLGICLGMQILARTSEEMPQDHHQLTDCLGFCDAPVVKMQASGLPLPHMGWNTVTPVGDTPLFKGIETGAYFYFVHSYALPVSRAGGYTLACCEYAQRFSAALQSRNYYGVQFHPERSGKAGAQLIKNFLELPV